MDAVIAAVVIVALIWVAVKVGYASRRIDEYAAIAQYLDREGAEEMFKRSLQFAALQMAFPDRIQSKAGTENIESATAAMVRILQLDGDVSPSRVKVRFLVFRLAKEKADAMVDDIARGRSTLHDLWIP